MLRVAFDMRTVPLWIGKTDDTPPPPRVKLRVWHRENGICYLSGRKIQPGDAYQFEHKIAIANGGRNSEDNLFLALVDKHKEKTKIDLAEKSRVADRAKSHIGIQGNGPKIQSAGFKKKVRSHEGREPVVGVTAFMRQIQTIAEGEDVNVV